MESDSERLEALIKEHNRLVSAAVNHVGLHRGNIKLKNGYNVKCGALWELHEDAGYVIGYHVVKRGTLAEVLEEAERLGAP